MDLVKILNEAIERLPKGDHSSGLAAIMRHISIAIKHFDRRGEGEIDSFTDAIYRTNQAYEGSLKEAYRVLAERDPAGKTPNDIEKYLESHNVVRPRVLTQLTRYRQDYRNPSTHDHKLDFDEDEAILAIVSVCAFAKLLVDQISERLAFEVAATTTAVANESLNLNDPKIFADTVVKTALEFARNAEPGLTKSEFHGGLAGALSAHGYSIDFETTTNRYSWDVFVSYCDLRLAIETRSVGAKFDKDHPHGVLYLAQGVKNASLLAGLAILFSNSGGAYQLYRATLEGVPVYIVCRYDIKSVRSIDRELTEVEKLE